MIFAARPCFFDPWPRQAVSGFATWANERRRNLKTNCEVDFRMVHGTTRRGFGTAAKSLSHCAARIDSFAGKRQTAR